MCSTVGISGIHAGEDVNENLAQQVADERLQLAAAVRAACIATVVEAYEEGGIFGLCAEGRWEYAVSALQRLDLAALVAETAP